MGNISWMFGVIGLRSVQVSFPISACLEAASKTGYLEEDSMAPGNWVVELGIGDSSCELLRLCRGEGENVFPSSFIKPCETNWNKMLSIPMMWVRSTCHRRCDLSEIWELLRGREEEKRSWRSISKEGRACVEGEAGRWDPQVCGREMWKTEPGVRQAPWFLWPQESLTNRTAFPLVIRC